MCENTPSGERRWAFAFAVLLAGFLTYLGDAGAQDCNTNGIDDACDLDCGSMGGPCDVPGCGLSEDCNGNGVPDSCDIDPGGILEIIDEAGDGMGNVLNAAGSIAVDSAGNVFVSGTGINKAFRIDPAGAISQIIDTTGDGLGNNLNIPRGIAADLAGNAYVVGEVSDNAFKITPAGIISEIIDASGDSGGNGLDGPNGIAVDVDGNVYVAGRISNNVFKITPSGVVTEIIDTTGDGNGNGLIDPLHVAVDLMSNVYVAGGGSDNVFKITSDGVVTQIMDETGDGTGNPLAFPIGIAASATGIVYVAGGGSSNAFTITSGGVITEIIDGTGDGQGNALVLAGAIEVDAAGNVYVTGSVTDNVFKIDSTASIIQVMDASGDGNGNTLKSPSDIAVNEAGYVYVTGFDSDNAFRIMPSDCDSNGVPDECDIANCIGDPGCADCDANGVPDACDIVSCPGDPACGDCNANGNPDACDISAMVSMDCNQNGLPDECDLNSGPVTLIIDFTGDGAGNVLDLPYRIAVGPMGTAYVSGTFTDNAFKITSSGVITEMIDMFGDGVGNTLDSTFDVAADSVGNAYVTGAGSHNVFRISPTGIITEIIDAAGDGQGNNVSGPRGVTVDEAGNVYVTCSSSDNAFKIMLSGEITQIIDATGDGEGNILDNARRVAVDADGNAFVTGGLSDNAFKITPAGVITEIISAANGLDGAEGIAVDKAGNVYVSGSASNNAFRITPAGTISQIIDATGDGKGNVLQGADSIGVDGSGNVYVSGWGSDNAFKITPDGAVTQIIDTNGDGIGNSFDNGRGLAVDSAGNVYITGLFSNNAFIIPAPDSLDCNTNGIPDECDIANCLGDPACEDCNANGVPDLCDVGASSGFPAGLCLVICADDCNENGTPDECEIPQSGVALSAWQSPSPGLWNTPSNWCLQEVPNDSVSAQFDASIDDAGSNVTLDISPSLNNLTLTNGAIVQVNDGSGANVRTLAVEGTIVHTGIFRATDRERLVLDAPAIDQGGVCVDCQACASLGVLEAVDGVEGTGEEGDKSILEINGSDVIGGIARTVGTRSEIHLIGGAKLVNVCVQGIVVPDGQTGAFQGTITNDGVLNIAPNGASTSVLLPSIDGSGVLEGNGGGDDCVRLGGQTVAQLGTFKATFTNASNHRIDGAGIIFGGVLNEGTIDANMTGQDLIIFPPGSKLNNGLVMASAGGTLRIADDISGSGSYLADLGTINILENISENPPGSNVGLTSLGGIINIGQGLMQVSVDGCGPIVVLPKSDVMGDMAGEINVNDSTVQNASSWDIGNGLIGIGLTATLSLVNNSTGIVNGPVTVHQNGTLEIDNSSLTATDLILDDGASLLVSSTVTLSGSLQHDLTDSSSAAWSWGAGSTLTMNGGQAAVMGPCTLDGWALLEAASEDSGPTGGVDDFEYADLALAAGAHVSLFNLNDNHSPAVTEAVYADDLTLGTGAVLNLNGLNLYVGGVPATPGLFDNGTIEDAPRISLVGDFNDDSIVDTDDIAGFVSVLLGSIIDPHAICAADLNGDGTANALDIQGFIATIASP